MVFSSLQFILIFMPIFFTVYYLTPGKYRNAVLLAGSLAFYLVGTINTPVHFILFVASIVADFLAGICMENSRSTKKRFYPVPSFFICSVSAYSNTQILSSVN